MQDMSNAAVKHWLSRGKYIKDDIAALESAKLAAWEAAVRTGAECAQEKVQTSGGSGEGRYIRYAEYSRKLELRRTQLITILGEIESAVYRVENAKLRTILSKRYLVFESWNNICSELRLSRRHVLRLHCKAMQEVRQYIPEIRGGAAK